MLFYSILYYIILTGRGGASLTPEGTGVLDGERPAAAAGAATAAARAATVALAAKTAGL